MVMAAVLKEAISEPTDTNVESVERNGIENYNMTDIINDVHRDSGPKGVKVDADKGLKKVKEEGGFLNTLKDIGMGILKSLGKLLIGTLTMAASLLMGRGLGMSRGAMGMGGILGNPLGMLFGSAMSPNFWSNNEYSRGDSSFLGDEYRHDNNTVNIRELEPVLKNLGYKLKELLDENKSLKDRLGKINILSKMEDKDKLKFLSNPNKYNISSFLGDYGNILTSGLPLVDGNTLKNSLNNGLNMGMSNTSGDYLKFF